MKLTLINTTSLFPQLQHNYGKSFHSQSLMADSRTELAQARGSCGELRRDLGAQKLHARALDLQLKQVEHDRASCASSASVTSAGAKKIPVLLAELVQ